MKKVKGLAGLKSAGAIRPADPILETIEWTVDGEQFQIDVFIKPMAFGMALDVEADDSPDKHSAIIGQMVLVEETGKLVPLGSENARNLHPKLGFELLKAVNRAVGGGSKNSQPRTNSSANSSSTASAAEPSQKPATD